MSSKPNTRQGGVTLIEMIVTIVLFTVMASFGAMLVSKLTPSYMLSVETEQTVSAREATLWRIAEDFRRSLLDGSFQSACLLRLNAASGVGGAFDTIPVSYFVDYEWMTGTRQLWMSSPQATSALLLDNVDQCPFTYASGVERARLLVNFGHYADGSDAVRIPVSAVYYSFVNGPYVASAVLGGGAISTVTVTGFFPGLDGGGNYNLYLTSAVNATTTTAVSATVTTATTPLIVADVTPLASAVIDVKVVTPEGRSILKQIFQFP